MKSARVISPLDGSLCAERPVVSADDTGRGGALSVIGFHNLTRPKSCHLRKV